MRRVRSGLHLSTEEGITFVSCAWIPRRHEKSRESVNKKYKQRQFASSRARLNRSISNCKALNLWNKLCGFAVAHVKVLCYTARPCTKPIFGDVAQLGERRVRNAKVGSSILLVSTK